MPAIEGLSMPLISTILTVFGLPGAVLVLWYVDHRRYDRLEKKRDGEVAAMLAAQKEETSELLAAQREETGRLMAAYQSDIGKILSVNKDDMAKVTRYYEDNVLLVKNYQRLADDLAGVITLNTQVQTRLAELIKNNMYCPVIREKGPHGA